MQQKITPPALRIKLTGVCNRTCSFCHEEGDMRTIGSIEPNSAFFECVQTLIKRFQLNRVMLTGGEPTIHSKFRDIVLGISAGHISVTSNGIRPIPKAEWLSLKESGLKKAIISIHDASPQQFLQLELRKHPLQWAVQAIESQKSNLVAASEAGLTVRVNTVVYHSHEQALEVLKTLEELQQRHRFEIRLLNDLSNVVQSQKSIRKICELLDATEVEVCRKAGSSNVTVRWETPSGFQFSTKMSFRYFFGAICDDCPLKVECHEGFYGIRLERRLEDYWVRLCIYKHIPEVLMPWGEFLDSKLALEFQNILHHDRH